MFYAPHKLFKRVEGEETYDEYGRLLPTATEWEFVCNCRCDDNATREVRSANGEAFIPSYHVVCDGIQAIEAGTYCKCMDAEGNVRGEGEVTQPKRTNYLNYTELWM